MPLDYMVDIWKAYYLFTKPIIIGFVNKQYCTVFREQCVFLPFITTFQIKFGRSQQMFRNAKPIHRI